MEHKWCIIIKPLKRADPSLSNLINISEKAPQNIHHTFINVLTL